MKKLITLAAVLSLTACVHQASYNSAPQYYRAKGQDAQTVITGKLDQSVKDGVFTDEKHHHLTIYFDGNPQIIGELDRQGTGEFTGQDYNNKKTSASCSAKPTSKTTAELKCIVFIENERAATLIM